jgi:hypothetical protein
MMMEPKIGLWERMMTLKILAAAAALTMLAAGAAHAGDYGRPPYASGAYGYAGYDGGGCGGFTLAGAHAGVTVLGINVGARAQARIGGGCEGGSGGAAYAAPQPAYQDPAYQGPSQGSGGYYGQPVYQPAYAAPAAYPAPAYAPQAYPQPPYGYAPQPCGCAPAYGYARPY